MIAGVTEIDLSLDKMMSVLSHVLFMRSSMNLNENCNVIFHCYDFKIYE